MPVATAARQDFSTSTHLRKPSRKEPVRRPAEPDLIAFAIQGNESAFEMLYQAHRRRIYSLCLRMVHNVSDAEDLTQEAFLQAFRKLQTFRGDSAFSTWLHRLAVNVVLMRFRKRHVSELPLEDTPGPEDSRDEQLVLRAEDVSLSHSVDRITLERVISRLPPGYQLIFQLHDVLGYEHREIAEILDCSIGNSKSQLHKARLKLRDMLKSGKKRGSRHSLASCRTADDDGLRRHSSHMLVNMRELLVMRSCLRLLGNSDCFIAKRTAKGRGAIHVSMERPVSPLVAASCSLVVLAFLLLAQSAFAQSDQQSADCTFQDGKQLSIRYETVKSDKLPQSGKVWMPGGSPLTLFSQATLDVGGSHLPPAAYSLYVIPGEEQWTLIVNKNVTAANKYDKAQDVVRLPMQTAKLGQPVDHMKVILGRMAPMQCNLRIYYGSVGAFGIEMKQK